LPPQGGFNLAKADKISYPIVAFWPCYDALLVNLIRAFRGIFVSEVYTINQLRKVLFIMNQHTVQNAYLKNFEDRGKIWVFNKETGGKFHKGTRMCTTECDFQDDWLEDWQNSKIERPGIEKLRKLTSGDSLKEIDTDSIIIWTSLHYIRSKSFRCNLKEKINFNYNEKFDELFEEDIVFANSMFPYILTYNCPPSEFLITSDNPVLEFHCGENYVRVVSWTPNKAIVFSHIDVLGITHEELSFSEMINIMLYSGCYKEIYSNKKELPLEKYKEYARKFNCSPDFYRQKFQIKWK
jgi:hypothetical protein